MAAHQTLANCRRGCGSSFQAEAASTHRHKRTSSTYLKAYIFPLPVAVKPCSSTAGACFVLMPCWGLPLGNHLVHWMGTWWGPYTCRANSTLALLRMGRTHPCCLRGTQELGCGFWLPGGQPPAHQTSPRTHHPSPITHHPSSQLTSMARGKKAGPEQDSTMALSPTALAPHRTACSTSRQAAVGQLKTCEPLPQYGSRMRADWMSACICGTAFVHWVRAYTYTYTYTYTCGTAFVHWVRAVVP